MYNYQKVMRKAMLAFSLFFCLLFAAATALLWYLDLPLYYGIAASVITVFLQYLMSPVMIHMLFDITYDGNFNNINPRIYDFLRKTCSDIRIPVPEIGIIDDGTPNAFTFGYTSRHAKLVVTEGLLDKLTEDEIKAVLSHELGHIKHNDFIAMMVISLIPMILYQIYLWTRKSDKGKPLYWIGITAYAVYILGQYMVLFFSRIREYYADSFAREIMGSGDTLKSALVKIAYGYTAMEEKSTIPAASLGIANTAHSEGFVLNYGNAGNITEKIERLSNWEMNNIWSRWYELNSTHPLTAKRIIALDDKTPVSSKIRLKVVGNFAMEAVISILPWTIIAGIALINYDQVFNRGLLFNLTKIFWTQPYLMLLLGMGTLMKYYYSYRPGTKNYTIEELLQLEDASPVAGIPAVIKGKIIGKGIPGLFYSEDLVIDDGSSFMLIDYRQPLRILEFLFGVFATEDMKEKEVQVVGWYKRSLRPYFCCKYILVEGKKIISYSYITNQVWAYLLIAAGLIKWIL